MANNALQYIYAGFCEKPPHTDKPRGAPTTWNRVKLTSQSHARLGGAKTGVRGERVQLHKASPQQRVRFGSSMSVSKFEHTVSE